MIKEKQIALSKDKLDLFVEKWKLFVSIYDFMWPVFNSCLFTSAIPPGNDY